MSLHFIRASECQLIFTWGYNNNFFSSFEVAVLQDAFKKAKVLKVHSNNNLKMPQDGRDATQEESAHYANPFLIFLWAKDLF